MNRAFQCFTISLFMVFLCCKPGNAQDVINKYAKVLSVQSSDTTDVDSVQVNNPGVFSEGDTVLFIMMKGVEVYTPADAPFEFWGEVNNINNTGIYNILLVNKVSGSYVIFTTILRKIKTVKPGEVGQLVKFSGGKTVYEVNKPLTCKQWDPVEGTGGVFALIAGRKIILKDTIDVSGKGFLGGDPNYPTKDQFNGSCSAAVDSFYTENGVDSSGRKGESIVIDGFPLTRGMLYVANGGGGGNGKFSGGGGGSNNGAGGQGGKESESCSPGNLNLAGTGFFISGLYTNAEYPNRIFMGGGGGTGTQDTANLRFATKGGNGGGIIILVTDTIEASGSGYVRTKGGNVTDTASAGAGGGGGGGVIILEANSYVGNLNFCVEGGDGGWTDYVDPTGPGGFGGGGVIWHSGNSLPSNVKVKFENGKCGRYELTGDSRGAATSSSQRGTVISKLMIPLSGFLFNVMPDDQDICEGKTPVPFYASKPKGGTGTYTYRWIQSYDKNAWTDTPGKNDSIYYVPGALTDTTYYKRIVHSGATTDTSLILSINVLPVLQNNNIAADDTICAGTLAPEMKDDPFFNITGGDGTYTFMWESRTDGTLWVSAEVADTILRNATPLETTYYRRVVTSHVCSDISNSLTITVLESIKDNLLTADDSICENENGQPIYGQSVSGGDGTYTYCWQTSLNNSTWNPAELPNNEPDYDPDTLITTRYYRRIVLSGIQDVCKDTSNVIIRIVHPFIINNLISRDTIICMDDAGLILTQLSGVVGGGNGINYNFFWHSKMQGESWDTASGADSLSGYEPGILTDTCSFRRLVTSGACRDTSNIVEVAVQDSIMNNLIADHDTICRGAIPDLIEGNNILTGGNGIYIYQWELKKNFTGWLVIPGAIQSDYYPPSLIDTTYYRRTVTSGKCIHSSDPVTVIVQAPISNNIIKNDSSEWICYETSLAMDGTAGVTEMKGGDEVAYHYQWEKSLDKLSWTSAPNDSNMEDYMSDNLVVQSYFRRFVISGACSDVSASVTVSIYPRPTAEIVSATYPAECYDDQTGPVGIQVQLNLSGAPPFNLVYTDGYNNTELNNITSAMANFTTYFTSVDSTTYLVEIVELDDANECVAYSDSLTGYVAVTVFKHPKPVIDKSEDTVQVCDSMNYFTALPDVGIGYWTKAAGDENLFIDDSLKSVIQVSTVFGSKNSQYYKLYWNEKNWPVMSEEQCYGRDSIEVIFWKEPAPANAGSRPEEEYDTVIFFADYINLYADPPTAGRGKWTLVSGDAVIENDSLPYTYVDLGDMHLDEPTEYVFDWTITNGICPSTSDMLRISRRDLRVYGGFSPDGNRINDFFTIGGIGYTDSYDLKIFTRSGNLIRRIKKNTGDEELPGNELWDGTYENGKPLENGIYYYTLEVMKGDHPLYHYNGFIVITRE